MNDIDPNRRSSGLVLGALGAALCLAAPTVALRGLELEQDPAASAALGDPYRLAGRLERASAPGGYVDVYGPLSDLEARLVVGYRDGLGHPVAGR